MYLEQADKDRTMGVLNDIETLMTDVEITLNEREFIQETKHLKKESEPSSMPEPKGQK